MNESNIYLGSRVSRYVTPSDRGAGAGEVKPSQKIVRRVHVQAGGLVYCPVCGWLQPTSFYTRPSRPNELTCRKCQSHRQRKNREG